MRACAEKPSCEADKTEARAGGRVHLTCRMSYSGSPELPPMMDWYAGDDEDLGSSDETRVGEAQGDATRVLTTADDRRPFRCVATLGDVQQVCEVEVQVPREYRFDYPPA